MPTNTHVCISNEPKCFQLLYATNPGGYLYVQCKVFKFPANSHGSGTEGRNEKAEKVEMRAPTQRAENQSAENMMKLKRSSLIAIALIPAQISNFLFAIAL